MSLYIEIFSLKFCFLSNHKLSWKFDKVSLFSNLGQLSLSKFQNRITIRTSHNFCIFFVKRNRSSTTWTLHIFKFKKYYFNNLISRFQFSSKIKTLFLVNHNAYLYAGNSDKFNQKVFSQNKVFLQ